MVGANTESICDTRKQNCLTQKSGKCMKKQTKALQKLEKTCKKKFNAKNEECQDKKLKEAREKFEGECEKEIKPTCNDDCLANCKIPELRTCEEEVLKQGFAITKTYCTQLWDWIFQSEQHDAKTMDPIPKSVGGGRFKTIAPKRSKAA